MTRVGVLGGCCLLLAALNESCRRARAHLVTDLRRVPAAAGKRKVVRLGRVKGGAR